MEIISCDSKEALIEVLSNFKISGEVIYAEPYGDGHINRTYDVKTSTNRYILQKINNYVFNNIEILMENISYVLEYQKQYIAKNGGNIFKDCLNLVPTNKGKNYYFDGQYYYRMYYFIENYSTYLKAENTNQMYLTGKAFGGFQKIMQGIDLNKINDTIPNFHNTKIRYNNFLLSVEKDVKNRAKFIREEIAFINSYSNLYGKITTLLDGNLIPQRITHNDTKLNNVLIDEKNSKTCVIDLDTIMKGSIIYDYADSLRYGVNPAREDESDMTKIKVDLEMFKAYNEGFLSETALLLNYYEKDNLTLGVLIITLELAMRFLEDYLCGDKYFRIKYEDHNLVRCKSQLKLFTEFEKNYSFMANQVKIFC